MEDGREDTMHGGSAFGRSAYLAGRKALDGGDLDRAAELIGAAVSANPDRGQWRAVLGRVMLDRGRVDEAVEHLRRAVDQVPRDARTLVLLGQALSRAKQASEAEATFERAVEVDPSSIAAWSALGTAAIEREDLDTAKRAFVEVIGLNRDHATARARLADIAAAQGDFAEELRHRGSLAQLRSDHVPSLMHYAALLIKAGRLGEARRQCHRVSQLRPDHPAADAIAAELGRWEMSGSPELGVVSVGYYDAVYSKSQQYARDGADLGSAPHFDAVLDMLAEDQRRSILDLGCGPGQFAQFLRARSGIPYIGVDYSEVAIRLAKDRGVPDAEFRILNLVDEDLPTCAADTAIVCTEVLEHIADDLSLIEKLPPDRYCYFSVPSFDTFGHVRHFPNREAVRDRYRRFFQDFDLRELPIGSGRNRLYVFRGRRTVGPG